MISNFETDTRLPGISACQISAVTSHVRESIKNKLDGIASMNPSLVQRLFKENSTIGQAFCLIPYIKGIEPLCEDVCNIEFIKRFAFSGIDMRPFVQRVLEFPSHSQGLLLQTLNNIFVLKGDVGENEMRFQFSNRPDELSFVLDFLQEIRRLKTRKIIWLRHIFTPFFLKMLLLSMTQVHNVLCKLLKNKV